jgi:hypothetical protein
MTKKALVDCFENGHFISAQVHDELCASVRDEEHGLQIAKIMEETVKLKLPIGTDVELGRSWGHSMIGDDHFAKLRKRNPEINYDEVERIMAA